MAVDRRFALIGHNHDSDYSAADHNHDASALNGAYHGFVDPDDPLVTVLPDGWSTSTDTEKTTITHNLGHDNYIVHVTLGSTAASFPTANHFDNNFVVRVRNIVDLSFNVTAPFYFTLVEL